MSTSSSIPVLSDVLFYTSDDPYNFQTDNRPLYQLDSNVRHVASSLVGNGYGEHAAVAGGLLSIGRVVELLQTGLIRYPIGTTAQLANAGQSPVLGLVIGSTEAGLNRVIWSSDHLDLSSVGLEGQLGSPANNYLLVADCNDDVNLGGQIHAVLTPSASQIVFGQVKVFPYVTISSFNTAVNTEQTIANTAETNSHNLYGFTRLRNLLLAVDAGQAPIQYSKTSFYQSDIGTSNNTQINIMSAILSSDLADITADSTIPTYDIPSFSGKLVKERYTNFSNATALGDSVHSNSWSTVVYPTTLTGVSTQTYENYELAPVSAVTPNYAGSSTDLALFKTFTIDKYYQYAKVSSSSTLSGKLAVTATVFNPLSVPNQGGESGVIIIWNFYVYDATTGLERTKYRIVSTGAAASSLFSNTSIFPSALINLQ